MFRVTVGFETNILNFTFKNLADALQFIGDCIETSLPAPKYTFHNCSFSQVCV